MTYDVLRTIFYQLTSTTVANVPNAVLNNFTQPAEDEAVALIMDSDMRWQFDDSNLSDLPIATTTLTNGQKDYSLATSHLTIDRVECLDNSGNSRLLTPIDQHDVKYLSLTNYYPQSGIPLEYDKSSNSVFLYPTPNYTLAAALKIYFTRGPLHFDYSLGTFTDGTGTVTTSSPGFNSLFHMIIPLIAAKRFALANGKENKQDLANEIMIMEQKINDWYGLRSRDEHPRMGVSTNGRIGNISGVLNASQSDSNR